MIVFSAISASFGVQAAHRYLPAAGEIENITRFKARLYGTLIPGNTPLSVYSYKVDHVQTCTSMRAVQGKVCTCQG
jgi:hypothetical protein